MFIEPISEEDATGDVAALYEEDRTDQGLLDALVVGRPIESPYESRTIRSASSRVNARRVSVVTCPCLPSSMST